MDEYIEKEAFVAELKERQEKAKEWLKEASCQEIRVRADAVMRCLAEIKLTLDKLPSADVVPVVRCKDCKYYEEHHYEREGELPYIKGKCGNKFGLNRQYMVHPEEFCSRGERRE